MPLHHHLMTVAEALSGVVLGAVGAASSHFEDQFLPKTLQGS